VTPQKAPRNWGILGFIGKALKRAPGFRIAESEKKRGEYDCQLQSSACSNMFVN
jgi:hypothetical protein